MPSTARTARTRRHRPPAVRVKGNRLLIGAVSVSFERTLRLPEDGREYPLPPSLGSFPLRRVQDYAATVPAAWLQHGGVFLPMHQREAMWMSFQAPAHQPRALKVGVGKVCAVSGRKFKSRMRQGGRQDYVVVPEQPWLDGINAGAGIIKQFVAMPLGMGYTVEGQVSGAEEHGGIQLCAFDPKPGRFPARPAPISPSPFWPSPFYPWQGQPIPGPSHPWKVQPIQPWPQWPHYQNICQAPGVGSPTLSSYASCSSGRFLRGAEMGVAAGGRMTQKVYADRHGRDAWEEQPSGRAFVHIVSADMWTQITGEPMPPSPVSARTYAQHGFPWSSLYDEAKPGVKAPGKLKDVLTVSEQDAEHGFGSLQDDSPLPACPPAHGPGWPVSDGSW